MQPSPDTKDWVLLDVSDGVSKFEATPRLYFSDYNQGVMREPHIKVLPLKDLYLSPMELQGGQAEHNHAELEIAMGETKEINGYSITFEKFESGQHSQTSEMVVGAVLNVPMNGENHRIVPSLTFSRDGQRVPNRASLPAKVNPSKGTVQPQVMLVAVQVEGKRILLEFHGFEDEQAHVQAASLLLEVWMIPMMMVIWTGVVLIVAGSGVVGGET